MRYFKARYVGPSNYSLRERPHKSEKIRTQVGIAGTTTVGSNAGCFLGLFFVRLRLIVVFLAFRFLAFRFLAM